MDGEQTQVMTTPQLMAPGLDERVHCLELVDGLDVGRRHLIKAAGVSIGRAAPADIVIADSEVSRAHCRVAIDGEDLVVTDLNSTNGTFVDGVRVSGTVPLPVGAILQVGRCSLKHERLTGKQMEKSHELDRDLAKALSYVRALLPAPVREGPIRTDWLYQPCAKLGGDAFGYGPLSETLHAAYMIDVSGHGAGAAMHSVAVMNLMRQRALPGVDMARPGQVLAALNDRFQMVDHADLYFTMWYGVFDAASRTLEFAAAGHHPAYLVGPERDAAAPAQARNGLIGAMPGRAYRSERLTVPPGASIYLFSDGLFELTAEDGRQCVLDEFLPVLVEPPVPGMTESQRLYRAAQARARGGEFDDDVSILVVSLD